MTIIDQVERAVTETLNADITHTATAHRDRARDAAYDAQHRAGLLAAMQRHIHAVPASTR